jgi:hypothetical protein
METTAAIALGLLVVSEILPFTPLRGNGVVQSLLNALRLAFPYRK